MKKIFSLILFALMLSISSAMVYADTAPTCSITLPADNTAYTGTQTFAVAITSNGTGVFNVTGVNITVSSAVVGSNMSSDVDFVNLTSYSVGVDTTTITDIKTTTVTANIMINGSSDGRKYSGSCTSTGVDFDNTDPVCSCIIARENVEVMDYIEYDCGASTDTTTLTYSCIITYDDTSTETETDATGRFEDVYSLGEATVACTVTDEVSKTNTCSDLTVNVQGSEDYPSGVPISQQQKRKNTAVFVIILVVIVVIVAVAIVASQMKKGKKRK